MASPERLLVLENTSGEPITDLWDGVAYTFAPGERVTLVFGVATHFKNKHPEITVVEETAGVAPHVVYTEATIVNVGGVIDMIWDGHPYHFEPGAVATIDAALADALIRHARKDGGKLIIQGSSEPEVPAAAPTRIVEPELEAPKPRKTAKKKAEADA